MSTPSKKRRAARSWMHKHVAQEKKEREQLVSQARIAGRADIIRDMRALLPEPERAYNNERGGQDVISVIKKFPSPYEGTPVFRVPFPTIFAPKRLTFAPSMASMAFLPERMRFVTFRPIEHALTVHDYDHSASSLRWFTWEPDNDGENGECTERTKALFTGMNKLAYVARELEGTMGPYYSGHQRCNNCGATVQRLGSYTVIESCVRVVKECSDELRRRLGEFAPKTEEDTEAERYRFGRGYPFMGQRL